jgi:hypothetical protein
MDWQLVIAGYAAILSTFLAAIRVLEFRRDRPRLKLALSFGTGPGGIEKVGPDEVLQVTALNCGQWPIGVAALGLGLSTGAWIPAERYLDGTGATVIPGILGPQEHAAQLHPLGTFEDMLRENDWRLTELVVRLTDGRTVKQKLPARWRRLGHWEPG